MSAGTNYLNHEKGLWSWLTTLDHKRIGILYMISVMVFFAIGGLFAILIRTHLASPGPTVFSSGAVYNQFMTLHGAIMVFMVIIPGIPAFLGNFVLPLHLGAKDVAFPRLNLLSWYCLIIGALITFISLFYHGVDTGWTFYTPYSIQTHPGTTWVILGAFVIGFSSILTGLNFMVTVHKLRCKGMTFFRMPLFVWGTLFNSYYSNLSYSCSGNYFAFTRWRKTTGNWHFRIQNWEETLFYFNISFGFILTLQFTL